jgi:DNA-binding response OmpR family regulator
MDRKMNTTSALIVEDDPLQATMMAHLLSRAGYNAMIVHSGQKGIELAIQHKFDIIILDVKLPDVSGFEVCTELKQRHFSRHVPIVFVSADANEYNLRRGLEVGGIDFIPKPLGRDFTKRLIAHLM